MRGSIFYSLVLGFGSGVLLRSFFVISSDITLALVLFACVLLLIVCKWSPSYKEASVAVLVCSLAIFCGVLRTEYAFNEFEQNELSKFEGNTLDIRGVVAEEPDYRENSLLLTIRSETPGHDTILVRTTRGTHVLYGDAVSIKGMLERPEAFTGDFGRTFKYPEYLRAHGITYTMRTDTVVIDEHGKGNRIRALLYGFKGKLIESVENAIPEPASGLGLGLVLGEKRALGKEWTDIFRVAGLIHIVVLSGYNITIVSEFVMRTLAGVLTIRRRLFVGGFAILLIVLMVGPSASVLRAAVMAGLVLLARGTGKTYELARALCFAGLLMLLHNPLLLAYDPGFEFSFLATLGLIYLAPEIEKRLHFLPTRFQFREFLVATISAQIMVLPLLLYLTGLFSNVSILANMLVLPLVPLAMLATAVVAFFGLVTSTGAMVCGYIAYLVLSYILVVAKFLSELRYSSFEVSEFSFRFVVISYVIYAVVVYVLKYKQKENATLQSGISSEAHLYEITVEQTAPDSAFK